MSRPRPSFRFTGTEFVALTEPLVKSVAECATDRGEPEGTRLYDADRLQVFVRTGSQGDEKIAQEVIVRGCYERPLMEFEVVAGGCWLDIGAHIGTFTSLALKAGTVNIYFQPNLRE